MKKTVCMFLVVIMVLTGLGISSMVEVAGSGLTDEGKTIKIDVTNPIISPKIPVVTIPKAPSNLSVTKVSDSTLNLSWTDNSDNETGFIIERKKTGSSYAEIAKVKTNETSYTDTGWSAESTLYYRVKAYNNAGSSDYSDPMATISSHSYTEQTSKPSSQSTPTAAPLVAPAAPLASGASPIILSNDITLDVEKMIKLSPGSLNIDNIPVAIQKDVKILYPTGGEIIKSGELFLISLHVKTAGSYSLRIYIDGNLEGELPFTSEANTEFIYPLCYSGDTLNQIKIKIVKLSNNSIIDESEEFSLGVEPAANYSLNATAGNKSVSLSWDPITAAPGRIAYNIYKSTDLADVATFAQGVRPITDFAVEESSYIDNTVENGTDYYYNLEVVIKGVSSTAKGLYSPVSAKPQGVIILQVGSPNMTVNGEVKEIDPGQGTAPVIVNGRTFVPIRAIIESMGGSVSWDGINKVTIDYNHNHIELKVGFTSAAVNGVIKELEAAPYISETGRTMLPLRFITENLGCDVDWEWTTKTITIKY